MCYTKTMGIYWGWQGKKMPIDLPKPRATAESNSSQVKGHLAMLLCFEQLSTLFSLSHLFFFFFKHILLQIFSLLFQTLPKSCQRAHTLFPTFSLSFSQILIILTFLFSNHSLFSQPVFFFNFYTLLYYVLFLY